MLLPLWCAFSSCCNSLFLRSNLRRTNGAAGFCTYLGTCLRFCSDALLSSDPSFCSCFCSPVPAPQFSLHFANRLGSVALELQQRIVGVIEKLQSIELLPGVGLRSWVSLLLWKTVQMSKRTCLLKKHQPAVTQKATLSTRTC